MAHRPVVVVSGKTCSGKTGLADLLVSEYGFFPVRTREILAQELALGPATAGRPALIAEGVRQDQDTDSRWVIQGVLAVLAGLDEHRGVVVDHLSSPAQVAAFRRQFGPSLIHVHLYADQPTLLARYAALDGLGEDTPTYDAIDHLKRQEDIVALKHDADVRIFTGRTDARDTLVRVAARLHLFTPPEVRCVDVLVGGQYGSEGKGNIVAYLAREYDVLVRVGGPNAGHTVTGQDGTYIHHHLPSGARGVRAKLLLGPGMTIRVKDLLDEITECGIGPDRLFIDPQAMIIEDSDPAREAEHLVGTIGSTGSGSGAAMARRILDRGSPTVRMARDIEALRPYVGIPGNYHGTTADCLERAYRAGQTVLLEGTQGSGLSTFHGQYPYVTSRDTNVAGCLAEAGISPSRVRKILMVVRPMPIRVGNPDGDEGHTSGGLKHETTFRIIATKAGLDPDEVEAAEITSTTKRKRRVGWFEWDQFRRACALNAPTDLVLTFADYLDKENRQARRFEQLHIDTIKFIEELERVAQAPVSLINTRFQRKELGEEDLRSIIDRRNWTARPTDT